MSKPDTEIDELDEILLETVNDGWFLRSKVDYPKGFSGADVQSIINKAKQAIANHYARQEAEAVQKAYKLWKLLDDIDTLEDMAKDNDAAFRKSARKKHRQRFDIMSGEEFDRIAQLTPQTEQERKEDE